MDFTSLTLPTFEPGWVWLTGAGPGDAGLMTLHALNGLKQADVIVYDALVGDDILSLAGPDTVLEYAGKRGGKPSLKQIDISQKLIKLAGEGKRVLRLKGGDPFVFGRGGEEALTLVEAQIPFRIIPGISAGLGGLAYAGLPLTHRDVNAAVTFATGHSLTGDVPDSLDWQALAVASPVLVIYMGMKHMGEIRKRLLEGGRDPQTPVAIVTNATLPNMRVLETDLATCLRDADAAGMKPPSLLVVGDIVRLRSGLDWLGAAEQGRVLVADPLGPVDIYRNDRTSA